MDSTKIPKQLAAYRLGLLGRSYTMWSRLFQSEPSWNTVQGPLAALERLVQSVVCLANEISPNTYNEMRLLLEAKSSQWRMVEKKLAARETGAATTWPAEKIAEAVRDRHPSLTTVADLASDALEQLRPWYRFGSDLGQLQAELWNSSEMSAGRWKTLPGQIIKAACDIPSNERRQIPCLQYLASTKAKSKRTLPRLLCAALHEDLGFSESKDSVDFYAATKVLHSFDAAIQRQLESIETKVHPAIVKLELPALPAKRTSGRQPKLRIRWHRRVRTLYVNGELDCKLGPRADNLMLLLDAFQKRRWAAKIPDPFHKRAVRKLRETAESIQAYSAQPDRNPAPLNDASKKLTYKSKSIEFHGDGEGNVEWQPKAAKRRRSPQNRSLL